MTTNTSLPDFVEISVEELKAGDIFDVSSVALGYGWRYHVVRKQPKRCNVHPENVHFDCDVMGWRTMEKRRRDYAGWPLHVNADARVRVYVGDRREELANERFEDSLDEE